MALKTRNFREWKQITRQTEEYKRPDSPTIMVMKTRPSGQFLIKSTLLLVDFYSNCNPLFHYDFSDNPTRPLTKPSEPR